MKKELVITLGAVGLLLLANKSKAATNAAARSRTIGGYGGYGVGAVQPIRSSNLSNSYYGRTGSTPDIWTQVGQSLAGLYKSGTFDNISGNVGSIFDGGWSGGTISSSGAGSGAGDIINGLDLGGTIADQGLGLSAEDFAASSFTDGFASFGFPEIAAVAAIDSQTGGGLGNTITDVGNGAANTIADIFGW